VSSFAKKTVRDIDVRGKRVLVRVDFNVPLTEDGGVADDTRIRESLPTIRYLQEQGARVILVSHLGRPKGPDPKFSLRPVAKRLEELLGAPVAFAEDCVGAPAFAVVEALPAGGVALLENLRFHPGEEANDPEFAKALAALCDVYVNDAFGTAHRAHASTEGVARLRPAVAGFLMEKELRSLGELVESPPRPFAAVVGGAKVSSKLAAVRRLLEKVDRLVIGGGMANTFLAAQGFSVGRSLIERELVAEAAAILNAGAQRGVGIVLPVDVVAAPSLDAEAEARVVPVQAIPDDLMALDIGPASVEAFRQALEGSKAVVWNGPMGVFERPAFAKGSLAVARIIAELDAVTVVGGGETVALVAQAGLQGRYTHVSTGGGASLEMLEGKTLPGVAALLDKEA